MNKATPKAGTWQTIDKAEQAGVTDGRDVLVAWASPQGRQLVAHWGEATGGAIGWVVLDGSLVTPTHFQELDAPPEPLAASGASGADAKA